MRPKNRVGKITELSPFLLIWPLTRSPIILYVSVYATYTGVVLSELSERITSSLSELICVTTALKEPKSIPKAPLFFPWF